MIRHFSLVLACLAIAGLSPAGCSHSYQAVQLNLSAQGKGPVAVAVLEQRPYIHAAGKRPDFVGVQYSLEGIPFDVHTGSGSPLADEWADCIVSSLRARGFDARVVPTSNMMERAAVARSLAGAAPRSILVSVKEWKVDARQGADLSYDVRVQALDARSNVTVEVGAGGRDHLGADFVNGATFARDQSLASFKAKLEQLLNDPRVVASLAD
jgi:hypothetical protein